MSFNLAITAEPIAGYTLTEQIGAGGYGEVWKADAPGGLTKAVKLVFGHMQDHWAACELRSLRRIKEVRHPFLLSLERIEIVDGQLIIVTELADGSLKDRYVECRQSGLAGIRATNCSPISKMQRRRSTTCARSSPCNTST